MFVENALNCISATAVTRTEFMAATLTLRWVARREVLARFDGGTLTSDGGAVVLREVDRATNLLSQFAACCTNHRDPMRVTHSATLLVRQRVTDSRSVTKTKMITTRCATIRSSRCLPKPAIWRRLAPARAR